MLSVIPSSQETHIGNISLILCKVPVEPCKIKRPTQGLPFSWSPAPPYLQSQHPCTLSHSQSCLFPGLSFGRPVHHHSTPGLPYSGSMPMGQVPRASMTADSAHLPAEIPPSLGFPFPSAGKITLISCQSKQQLRITTNII